MKETILQYIIEQFAEKTDDNKQQRTSHYSYCSFPEEKCTCKDLNDITYDTPLITGGYIDSFSMVMVLVYLQKQFNVNIPDKEATPENFNTVNNMYNLVMKHKS